MKRIVRATQLEKFRRWISDKYEYETEQGVIDSITGEFKGNAYTWIGTAFHSIVETGKHKTEKVDAGERTYIYYGKEQKESVPCGRKFNIDGNDVILDIPQCKVALEYRNEHPHALHEVREFMDFGEVIVTGQADMIDGLEIRDIKTKYSYPSDIDYIDSAQSHIYMQMFGADTFHYDLFIFEDYKIEKHGTDVRGINLMRYDPPITVCRYNGMEEDNLRLIGEFVDWAKHKNVFEELPTEWNLE